MTMVPRAARRRAEGRHARWVRVAAAASVAIAVPFACTDETINTAKIGSGGSTVSSNSASKTAASTGTATGSISSGTGGGPTSATSSSVTTGTTICLPDDPTCHPILTCHGHVYECGDGIDNDGNGLIDMDDPTCTGPCDNDEGGLYPNEPGQGPPCKVGCFFGPHSGNDGCAWDHSCDALEQPPAFYPESNHGWLCSYAGRDEVVGPMGKTCADLRETQTPQCLSTCLPLTPNGCDCFGCCELPAGTNHFVWLGSTNVLGEHCTMDSLLDPTFCQPCTPVMSCFKACTKCEKCIGKPTPDPGCDVSKQCPAGVQPCGLPGQVSCPTTEFCNTGCCYPLPG